MYIVSKKQILSFPEYLSAKKISAAEAAKALDVSRAYIHALLDEKKPSLQLAWKIEQWSDGVVTMQTWMESDIDMNEKKKKK